LRQAVVNVSAAMRAISRGQFHCLTIAHYERRIGQRQILEAGFPGQDDVL
jgi:hypothetical protein